MYIYTYIYIYARKLTVSQNGKPCGFKAVSLLRCQLSPACSRAIAPCHNNKQISLCASQRGMPAIFASHVTQSTLLLCWMFPSQVSRTITSIVKKSQNSHRQNPEIQSRRLWLFCDFLATDFWIQWPITSRNRSPNNHRKVTDRALRSKTAVCDLSVTSWQRTSAYYDALPQEVSRQKTTEKSQTEPWDPGPASVTFLCVFGDWFLSTLTHYLKKHVANKSQKSHRPSPRIQGRCLSLFCDLVKQIWILTARASRALRFFAALA